MSEVSARIVTQLEEVTRRMGADPDLSLPDLVALTRVREELVRQWVEHPSDDDILLDRLRAVVRAGTEAESRLRVVREALRQDVVAAERLGRLAGGLRGMIAPPPSAVNLEA